VSILWCSPCSLLVGDRRWFSECDIVRCVFWREQFHLLGSAHRAVPGTVPFTANWNVPPATHWSSADILRSSRWYLGKIFNKSVKVYFIGHSLISQTDKYILTTSFIRYSWREALYKRGVLLVYRNRTVVLLIPCSYLLNMCINSSVEQYLLQVFVHSNHIRIGNECRSLCEMNVTHIPYILNYLLVSQRPITHSCHKLHGLT
jgi:hypothetical protein